MKSSPISTTLGTLDTADGSATYSCNGFSVIGGVNGPVEVSRRDELPQEALIDVVIRPVAGVGGIKSVLKFRLSTFLADITLKREQASEKGIWSQLFKALFVM